MRWFDLNLDLDPMIWFDVDSEIDSGLESDIGRLIGFEC